MTKAKATVDKLVSNIEHGQLRLSKMQRLFDWRSDHVGDLFNSLYLGYPSGAILNWDTVGPVPEQNFAVRQQANPYASTQLLHGGQQRLASLSLGIRSEPVHVNGRICPIHLLQFGAPRSEASISLACEINVCGRYLCVSDPSNTPLEWTGHHR